MDLNEMVEEIRVDLGCDVNSLGISDDTIQIKIKEALRKISNYAPYVETNYFPVSNNMVKMPEDTVTVTQVLNQTQVVGNNVESTTLNDMDLFSVRRYMYNYGDLQDPFIILMQQNQMNTLQNFVSIKDWRYDSHSNTLYLNNFSGTTVSLVYLRKFKNLDEIQDLDIVQTIKEYALALCKIIEGQIRRKLQAAPGAIQLDGEALVSEGTAEKQRLDEWIPKYFMNLRFGIRC